MADSILVGLVTVHLALALWWTHRIVRRQSLGRGRKGMLLATVCLIPFIGVLLCFGATKSDGYRFPGAEETTVWAATNDDRRNSHQEDGSSEH